MFSVFSSVAKAVVKTAVTSSYSASKQSSSSPQSQSSTKQSQQSKQSSSVATVAKKAVEGVVISISSQAKAAAANASVTGTAISSAAHKGQMMQADKGLFHGHEVTDGYSPSYKPPVNPPRTPNLPDSEVYYTNQNSSHEASGNKQTGQVVYSNGNNTTVISDRDPYKKAVNSMYEQYRYSDQTVVKALNSGNKQELNEAVLAMKEAYASAVERGDNAARDAASKMADELRWKGASIVAETSLQAAKAQVVNDKYSTLTSLNEKLNTSLHSMDKLSLNEGVVEAKRLYAELEKAGDKIGTEAARKVADELRAKGATISSSVTYEQAVKQVDDQKTQTSTSLVWNKSAYSIGLDVVPFVGDVKGIFEAFTGKDAVTGQQLSSLERVLAASFLFPGRGLYKAGENVVDTVQDLKTGEKIQQTVKFGDLKPAEIPNMSKKEILDSLPKNWDVKENNGFVHVRDASGTIRMRIDPPDKVTQYDHVHLFNEDSKPLDINLQVVDKRSPDAHIPYTK